MSRRRRPGRAEGTLLAGWLFADLLLALSVIFLGVVPGPTTTTTTSTTTTTFPVGAKGLNTTLVCIGQIDLNITRDLGSQTDWIADRLSTLNATNRRIGFLLLSGGSQGGADGIREAKAFAASLQNSGGTRIAKEFARGNGSADWGVVATKNDGRSARRISMEAFFFNDPAAPELVPAPEVPGSGCDSNDDGQMP